MKTIRPLQLSTQNQVLVHNNQHYFVVSVTIGLDISSGLPILEFDWTKTIYDTPNNIPMPDAGMPKPNGEYLITGSYYAPNNLPTEGGEIKINFGEQKKGLLVFGSRKWENGLPTKPEPFTSLPINYTSAFGGKGFDENPNGLGFKDETLPNIETLKQLITSASDKPEPAGFSVFDQTLPQRKIYQGTYDEHYMEKYFPGYPGDFDWRYFNCAPKDQWIDEYYKGNEDFEIYGMHPTKSMVKGRLPGLKPRCFLQNHIGRTITPNDDSNLAFTELALNLDTVHFFPENELALLTWRGTIQVNDDEGEEIKNAIFAYESDSQTAQTKDYYLSALNRRLQSKDHLLNHFNTQDLIPNGHKCAMEILQEMALADFGDSELGKNLDAKAKTASTFIAEQSESINKQIEAGMPKPELTTDLPEHAKKIDFKELLIKQDDLKPDLDLENFNKKIENILPGITAGDPKKLELKNFSFEKLDKIMEQVALFTAKKKDQVIEGISHAQDQIKEQLKNNMGSLDELTEEQKNLLQDQLNSLEVSDQKSETPMPRMKVDEIIAATSQLEPQFTDAMNQLNSLKSAGIDNELTQNLEQMIKGQLSGQQDSIGKSLRSAEVGFKELYIKGAHFQENSKSPHKMELDDVKQVFLSKFRAGEVLADGDWACIDLSGEDLQGVDLSGAYLEQVNFTGANLSHAKLTGAILARANLDGADFSHADFNNANVGAVSAIKTNFSGADLKGAKLSRGNFSGADFSHSILRETETLEITINNTNFSEADATGFKIIDRDVVGANFTQAILSSSCFMQSSLRGVIFDSAQMQSCVFADTTVTETQFKKANLLSTCFAVTEDAENEGKGRLTNIDFSYAIIEKSNFQNIFMPETNFTGASVINCNFNGADLSNSNLSQANMPLTQFRKAKLTGSNLRDSNFNQAFFAKAHLVSADLSGSNFYGADFIGAVFGETKTRGCNFDATILKDWRPS
jgi:uncharacterized protein YjbI with pentapeptide repeats